MKIEIKRECPIDKVLHSIVTKRGCGYISNVIGEEYMRWSFNDLILINAPTGSGKTTFILHTLLPYVASKNEKILYLVNRKILKKQIGKELDDEVEYELYKKYNRKIEVGDCIDVETYQSIEEKIKNYKGKNLEELKKEYKEYTYVVYDECHYFAVDSTYNTYTQLSLEFLADCFFTKPQIYISATMDCIRERIVQTSFELHNRQEYDNSRWMEVYEYAIEKDYGYVYINTFNDMSHLKEIILANSESYNSKWLIFVESIDDGRQLQDQLIKESGDKKLDSGDIVFIDAKFEQNEDADESVKELDDKKLISKKIIIATSVLDNGVSFNDINLRNIVITADSYEEFIQMLGRKRKDQDIVKLFIQKRSEAFFNRRYQSIKKVLKTYAKFKKDFQSMYGDNNFESWYLCMYEDKYSLSSLLEAKNQQNMLKNIMNNPEIYRHFTKFTFVLGGFLVLNNISINRLESLQMYYKEIAQKLGKDPDAFLKLQLSWLGITEDGAGKIIEDCGKSEIEHYSKKIQEYIETVLCDLEDGAVHEKQEFDRQGCVEFKNGMKNECIYILKHYGEKLDPAIRERFLNALGRNDRPITADQFNAIMEIIKLPYSMTGNNPYIISRK